MGILTAGKNQIEVRLRRVKDGTYFDEYVKFGEREKDGNLICERYVVAEPDTPYIVEVIWKKGYDFGGYSFSYAKVYLPGEKQAIGWTSTEEIPLEERGGDNQNCLKEDLSIYVHFTGYAQKGNRLFKRTANFDFQSLAIDELLDNETNAMGVNPDMLGGFRVLVNSYNLIEPQQKESPQSLERKAWESFEQKKQRINLPTLEVRMVDKKSYKKHGKSHTLKLSDQTDKEMRPTIATGWHEFSDLELNFKFFYSNLSYYEHLTIVKYPPPLHHYGWSHLTEVERKIAFDELQILDRKHTLQVVTSGRQAGSIAIPNNMHRRDWQSWNIMEEVDREAAFKNMQKRKKEFNRGKVQQQVQGVEMSEVIVIDDAPTSSKQERNTRSTIKSENREFHEITSRKRDYSETSTLVDETSHNSTSNHSQLPPPEIKREPIDLDSDDVLREPVKKKIKLEPDVYLTENDGLEDMEMAEMEKKAAEMAREIEEEERLAKRKRDLGLLNEKIQAAKLQKRRY